MTVDLGPAAKTFRLEESYAAINRLYQERGWTDGLPIVPPTAEAVAECLRHTDRDPRELIAVLPPRQGEATVERIAVNTVMAGCRPEYLPVVITAIEALADPGFNLDSIQATTHPVAPLMIVNGPIARELGINSGYNAFGQGFAPNLTIGRAVRLVLMNLGGGLPGTGDRSTQGSPAKIAYCVAENEDANPWEPLHVEAGIPARRQHRHRVRLRGAAQYPGPLQLYRHRRPQDHRRRHGAGGEQQPARRGRAAAVPGPRARRHHRPRRVQQAAGEGVRLRARALSARPPRGRVPPLPRGGAQDTRTGRTPWSRS